MTDQLNQVVAVTGSAQGIGKSIAEAFAAEGASVAILDINEEGAHATASELADKYSVKTWAAKLDVSDSEVVTDVFKRLEKELGAVTVLINNAGVTRDTLLMRMKDEQWDTVIKIHLNGTFYCSRAVTRSMLKQRYGRIINMASIVGLRGQAGQANYAAAKAGIIGFTKALAQELATRGVTVNAIAPGFIQTAMTDALPEDVLNAIIESVPMRRKGSVEDVASAVSFLASQSAGYITGVTIPVDGGLAMM